MLFDVLTLKAYCKESSPSLHAIKCNYVHKRLFRFIPLENLWSIHIVWLVSLRECMKTLEEYSPRHFSPLKSLWPFLCSIVFVPVFFVATKFFAAFLAGLFCSLR